MINNGYGFHTMSKNMIFLRVYYQNGIILIKKKRY